MFCVGPSQLGIFCDSIQILEIPLNKGRKWPSSCKTVETSRRQEATLLFDTTGQWEEYDQRLRRDRRNFTELQFISGYQK